MDFIHQLKTEHKIIVQNIKKIEEMNKRNIANVFLMFLDLSKILLSHLAKEDSILYPYMKKSDDKDLVKIAVEFELDMKNISLSISNFIENYRYEKHMQNDSIFTEDFNKALQALKLRIVKEEKELYAACKNCLVKKKNY